MRIRFLEYPIHPMSWQRPPGDLGYRITAGYHSEDVLNGGKHMAVDVGNFREGDPVYAPADCTAMGLRHFDGALGIRFQAEQSYAWEVWHLDSVLIPVAQVKVIRGQKVGTTGNTGANLPSGAPMPRHTHIELERAGVRIDPESYLLGTDFPYFTQDDQVPRLRPVREQWNIPAGTDFWLDGPEQGLRKQFTTPEKRWSNSESTDNLWRLIEYGGEVLWVKRSDINAVAGTRNPASGYGSPAMGATAGQVKAAQTTAADKVLEAAKAAAKLYGAS